MAKFYAERVKLDRGGYDSRGRYWGVGAPLYLVEQVTDSGSYENARHVRAKTAAEAKHKAFGVVSKPRKPRTSRAGKSTWNLEAKIADARSVRSDVHPDFLPLFDHLLNLARSSAEHGYMQRAGAEIAKAKGFAKKHPKRREGKRVSTLRAREVHEMTAMLKRAGYSNPAMHARKLVREGMGPYELEGRIKMGRGGVGSLEHSHGMRDRTRRRVTRKVRKTRRSGR